ncbi:RnfABCDGE type electron transport complex subunit D [Candidatus Hydrogenedentota bacterium]
MKFLLDIMEKFRPLFREGGAFARMAPVYDATEAIFFAPDETAHTAPHVRDPLDLKRFMSMVILAVAPCALIGIHHFGLRVIAMIIVSYAAGGTVEVLVAMIRKEPINEGFLVTGLLFPLILPPGLPLWMVGVGVAFGVLVGKEVFGGTGRNVFNPALVGRCFLLMAYPSYMSSGWIIPGTGLMGRALEWVDTSVADAISSATPLVLMKNSLTDPSVIPETVRNLFLGNTAGCVGATSALAILLGGVFLIIVGVASWRTTVGIFGSFIILGAILHWVYPAKFAPLTLQLFSGGLFFGAFFMATDPVTSPMTKCGQLVYGILIGTLTLLIRGLSGYPEGMMFAILLGNTSAYIFDKIAISSKLRKLADER